MLRANNDNAGQYINRKSVRLPGATPYCNPQSAVMADSNPTSDLQAILADLARYTSDPQPSVIAAETDSVPSASPAAATAQTGQTPSLNTPDNRANDPRLKPQGRSTASPQPIDPATITTWQDGLRCVTKIAAQNIQFAASIRRVSDIQVMISFLSEPIDTNCR